MNQQNKFILIGGVAGAALGAAIAWAYYKQQTTGLWTTKREDGRTLTVQAGAGDFFRVGVALYGIVRQIQAMAKPKQ